MAADACKALGITNPADTLDWFPADDKPRFDLGLRGQPPWPVNESGIYDLVPRFRTPDAREFRRWGTSEVLPAIRRNDRYMAPVARRNAHARRKLQHHRKAFLGP